MGQKTKMNHLNEYWLRAYQTEHFVVTKI